MEPLPLPLPVSKKQDSDRQLASPALYCAAGALSSTCLEHELTYYMPGLAVAATAANYVVHARKIGSKDNRVEDYSKDHWISHYPLFRSIASEFV